MNPLVSVIVPAYNIAPFVERCVNSILNQTYANLEVLLIDDGSTDDTPIIADELAKKDDRVKVFHIENGGVSNARNLALKNAKGDYISIIDGDDWVESTLFADAISEIEKNDADAFMFEYFVDYDDHTVTHSVDSSLYGVIDTEKAIEYSIDVQNRFAWSKIFKKELSRDIWFDTDIILGEDTLYICSVLAGAKKVVYSNNNYYHYIIREGSAVNSAFNRKKLSGITAYQGVVDLCEKLGYNNVAMISRKSLAILAISILKKILVTPSYKEKKEDIKSVKKVIIDCKKSLGNHKCLDKKTRIKLMLASININLLKYI